MNQYVFPPRSLKTRLALFTLVIFLIGIWSLAFYTSRMLREDMQHLLGVQQFATVSLLAAKINQELDDRLKSVEKIAREVTPAILGDPADLQVLLEKHPVFQSLFNGGTFITRIDGIAMASIPLSAERFGRNYIDRDYIAAALKEGKSTVGRPVMGRALRSPIFALAAPIRDTGNNVIGVLAGVTDLGNPNFLDNIMDGHYGKTGGYFLVAPQYRMIVTASDRTRSMEQFPAIGINPVLDQYLEGKEGSDVYVNPLGVEVLGSAKRIPMAGWFMGAILPTQEAFAPIRTMQQRTLLAAICLTLIVAALTWWMLRRMLSPMLAAVTMLSALSDSNQPLQPLPIINQDEIGELIGGFNRLLETLKQRDEALRESDENFRLIFESNSVPIAIIEPDSMISMVNEEYCKASDYTKQEIVGKSWTQQIPPEDLERLKEYNRRRQIDPKNAPDKYEFMFYHKNGDIKHAIMSVTMLRNRKIIASFLDITERKRMEKELLCLNKTLEQRVAQEVEKNLKNEILLIQQSRLAAMGEMIGNIAHQWRQPLNALGLILYNIKDAYQFNALDAAYLNQAVADGSRMVQKMSTTISDFAKFFRPNKESSVFSAQEQISEAVTLVASGFQNSDIAIHIEDSPDLKLVGFPNEFSQVLLNLLSNAKEAILAHNWTIPGRVDITLTEREGQGCISVSDNGGGIPGKILDMIFDPYFSTKETGSGIGLYMSKMIIERSMHGSITAKNIENGAEFRVCVPLVKEGE